MCYSTVAVLLRKRKKTGLGSTGALSFRSVSVPYEILPNNSTFGPPARIWRNSSVRALLAKYPQESDPVAIIRRLARETVGRAKSARWLGPPYSPADLASFLGIHVEAAPADIKADARIFPSEDGQLHLEFNPKLSRRRTRFSICHEISHTFFPDCYETIRHRVQPITFDPVHAELERLCNVGASELLMPLEDFQTDMSKGEVNSHLLTQLTETFDVSVEACLKRFVDLSREPCAAVFLEYDDMMKGAAEGGVKLLRLRLRYFHSSESWTKFIPKDIYVTAQDSAVCRCAGESGFFSSREKWNSLNLDLQVIAAEIRSSPGSQERYIAALIRPLASVGIPAN